MVAECPECGSENVRFVMMMAYGTYNCQECGFGWMPTEEPDRKEGA